MRRIITLFIALAITIMSWADTAYVKVTNEGETSWVPINGTLNGTNFNKVSGLGKSTSGKLDLREVRSASNGTGTAYNVKSIGDYAFDRCTGLTSVIIPNSVTSIGKGAFYGCTGLTSVAIPNSVTNITKQTFQNCTGLTSVTIPNTVTNIDYYAFEGCSSLASLTIPNSVTSIGESAFEGCIGLTSINIPNSVASIGKSAFGGCTGISSIDVENTNPIYDSRDNCNAIIETSSNTLISACKNTVIPNSVPTIGVGAFKGCSVLTSITIPNSVTKIENGAFGGCSGLVSISVDPANPIYDSREKCNAIIETSSNTLILGCINTSIPNSVTSIGGSAFYGCEDLTSITIPNSVTSIGGSAFYACHNLSSITIPNSVTSIGGNAFCGCSSLTSITLPNTLTTIKSSTFSNCSGLTFVTIPNSVTSIEGWVFYRCSSLTTVNLSNSLTSIGRYAFGDCSNLTSITIPNSLTSIGEGAFDHCNGLSSITIPNSVTTIDNYAFSSCYNLKNIIVMSEEPCTLPGNAFDVYSSATLTVPFGKKAKYQAAEGWSNFNTIVEMPSNPIFNTVYDNITYECDAASTTARVVDASGVTGSIVIPATIKANNSSYAVKTIGKDADYGGVSVFQNSTVKEIIVSEGIQNICSNALTCETLESVTLPTSLVSIGDYAFNGCVNLRSITIPNGVKIIGKNAFLGCTNLESAFISKSVTNMFGGIFAYCTNLSEIVVEEGNTVFDSRNGCNAIIVSNTNELLQGCNETVIPEDVTRLGDSSFAGFSFTSFNIPQHINSLGIAVFEGCSNLTTVTIPSGIKEIPNATFSLCSSLASISLPNGITTIGDVAFQKTAITELSIPSSVTTLGNYIVPLCDQLESVIVYYTNPFEISTDVFLTYDPQTWAFSRINATLYVPKGTKGKYMETNGWKEFVNIEEMTSITAIDEVSTVSYDGFDGQNLKDIVVDNVYYNLNGSDSGYDTEDGSIVIGGTTNMGAIENKEPGTSDVAQNFDGLILKVAKGSGTITVNVKTTGNAQLVVQVGNQTPMIASKNERGDVVVNYDVEEDTYVYIYAIIGSSNARSLTAHRIAADNAVKIYSVKVAPGATGINATLNDNVNANNNIYDLQGRRVEHPAKGIYIRNGRRIVVK